ncbi:hypothetical protein K440DRAFT_639190 [Wilcoxina mikolae CBS 423.85]|nr:hypothetical protein K440DRAFT_639190 [Wilcoxina mikolae CBS 423.85]
MFSSLRNRNDKSSGRTPPKISLPLSLVVPQNSSISSIASSQNWPPPPPPSASSSSLSSTVPSIPSPLRECHIPPPDEPDQPDREPDPVPEKKPLVSRSNESVASSTAVQNTAPSSTAVSTTASSPPTAVSSAPRFRAFPDLKTLASTGQNSIPFLQLLYQCKFLASEWDRIFSSVKMLPSVGAVGLCLLMDYTISYAATIGFECDHLIHTFRKAHITVPRSPGIQQLPPPPGLSEIGFSAVSWGRFRFGHLAVRMDVDECCRVWDEIARYFNEDFEEWLEKSPETAAEGIKSSLFKLVAVHSEMKRIAADGRLQKWCGSKYPGQKLEAEELRKKLESAGAEFLRIIGGNPEGAEKI